MRWLAAIVCTLFLSPLWAADFELLSGHGGPVKGVAISTDNTRALTASFDYSVGLWKLGEDSDPIWLEGHEAAVNAVRFLPENRAASAGDDFSIRLWDLESGAATHVLEGHQGKILSLAVSPDGHLLASAGWDGWIGLWDASNGTHLGWLKGHEGYVNDVAFAQDNLTVYSASNDGTIRRWDVKGLEEEQIEVRHGFGVNTLLLNDQAGWLAYGALDGGTRAIDLETGEAIADMTLDRRPILSMAMRPDGGQIAVGDGEGYIMVVDTADWAITRDFHAAKRGPVWALAYDGGERALAGGIDDVAYLWPLDSEIEVQIGSSERSFLKDPDEMDNGARQFYRKCSICHTLTPDTARRAGPSLFGVFGRKAGSLEGYAYSQAMRDANITWNATTIDDLFELGPDHYTPGSKMPMQRITRPEDRADLIAFLKRATRGEQE